MADPQLLFSRQAWRDPRWTGLSSSAQHLWFLLATQTVRPVPYDPELWATFSANATTEDRVLAFVELQATGWVTEIFGLVYLTNLQHVGHLPRLDTLRSPIPASVRLAIYERDGHRCVTCDTTESLTLDHVYPWSKGGTDNPENLQTMCRPCNSRKKDRV